MGFWRDGDIYWTRPATTNLTNQSQAFGNAAWSKTATTIDANNATAPDGTATACKLAEDNTNAGHRCSQSVTLTATPHVHSIFAKAVERSHILLFNGTNGTFFDLANGVKLGDLGSPTAAWIIPAGNGWYRCCVQWTPTAAAHTVECYISSNGSQFSYTGTTGSGVLIWQAQVSAGFQPGPIIPTTGAAVTVAGSLQ